MLARRCVENLAQIGMHWNGELGAGLFLLDVQNAVANVLAAHANNVAPTLRGVEQQREREPRLASDRMVELELCDLVFAPRGKAGAFAARGGGNNNTRARRDRRKLERTLGACIVRGGSLARLLPASQIKSCWPVVRQRRASAHLSVGQARTQAAVQKVRSTHWRASYWLAIRQSASAFTNRRIARGSQVGYFSPFASFTSSRLFSNYSCACCGSRRLAAGF
jgi:hypothetical protein